MDQRFEVNRGSRWEDMLCGTGAQSTMTCGPDAQPLRVQPHQEMSCKKTVFGVSR